MSFTPNARFNDLVHFLKEAPFDIKATPSSSPEYQQFIQAFPASALRGLTLAQYCIGQGNNNTFSWWLERGLQPQLGRYMPGTSRGHILYWMPDGSVYKNRRLRDLSDQDALAYTLKIQAAIATARIGSLDWIDNDAALYKAAGVEPRVTVGDGRKLRLLSAYHPDDVLPISSSDHLKHFLLQLGCPPAAIPKVSSPVARMLLLKEVYELARKQVPGLSTSGFVKALYEPELGLAPMKEAPTAAEGAVATSVADEADEVGAEEDDSPPAINLILQGPPGTGKTFATITEALKILDPLFLDRNAGDRAALKERYDELAAANRIRFVTFHQSFSYEDFVEGLRADADSSTGGQIRYSVEPGVFRMICEDAQAVPKRDDQLGIGASPRIWKISIDGTYPSPTRQYCLTHGEARIGWGHVGDLKSAVLEDPKFNLGSNDRSTLGSFSQEIEPGDILLCIGSATEVSAIGVVQGEYRFESMPPSSVRSDYNNVLPVKWIATGLKFSILELNGRKRFTLKTVYEIDRFTWPELVAALQAADVPLTTEISPAKAVEASEPYVLIIDEINRGNVSRILGELITLIEPSKRLGAPESLEVTLPYSKKRFGVPANVHLIGTMNTADRSLTGLDIALRRRFDFREMPPKPELLDNVAVAGIKIGEMLRAMNQRIEVLLDRDHCLGHTYFLPLRREPTLDRLAAVFRQNILPLLQEYFFEDAERIAWVLNDHNAPSGVERFIVRGGNGTSSLRELFGQAVAAKVQDNRWTLNEQALKSIESYRNIIRVGS